MDETPTTFSRKYNSRSFKMVNRVCLAYNMQVSIPGLELNEVYHYERNTFR